MFSFTLSDSKTYSRSTPSSISLYTIRDVRPSRFIIFCSSVVHSSSLPFMTSPAVFFIAPESAKVIFVFPSCSSKSFSLPPIFFTNFILALGFAYIPPEASPRVFTISTNLPLSSAICTGYAYCAAT